MRIGARRSRHELRNFVPRDNKTGKGVLGGIGGPSGRWWSTHHAPERLALTHRFTGPALGGIRRDLTPSAQARTPDMSENERTVEGLSTKPARLNP